VAFTVYRRPLILDECEQETTTDTEDSHYFHTYSKLNVTGQTQQAIYLSENAVRSQPPTFSSQVTLLAPLRAADVKSEGPTNIIWNEIFYAELVHRYEAYS